MLERDRFDVASRVRAMCVNPCPSAYPLLCRPLFQPKIWGGRKLESLLGKALPAGQAIGESWEVADIPEGASSVDNGEMAGRTLTHVLGQWGEALVGTQRFEGRFPYLIKFLHAEQDLSVQVHPSQQDCERFFPDERGKDESWIIVHADPGGRVLHGFRPGVTGAVFDTHLADGRAAECLRTVPVKPGDVIQIAPGTVHAIGRGVVLLEIQQASDSTFRIDDYGRLGDDGRPRTLHLDEARRVVRFDHTDALATPRMTSSAWGRHERLIDVPAYRIERVSAGAAVEAVLDGPRVRILVLLSGTLQLGWPNGSLPVRAGQTVVIPAAMPRVTLDPGGAEASFVLTGSGGHPLAEFRA